VKDVLQLLRRLEHAWPPPSGCHHAVVMNSADSLKVQVNYHGNIQTFILDEKDMERKPEDLADEIAEMAKKSTQDMKR
jgi:hypothetical protein